MANQLTGDFDVVTEFAIPAANRVLAAMHRIERFPHSLALSVDDTVRGPRWPRPSVVEVVDAYGDPPADHRRIGPPTVVLGSLGGSGAIRAALDPVINPDTVGVELPPVVPSLLKGRAQLQVSPPTIEVVGGAGATVRARMMLMSRYFPDPGTSQLAEFVRGELALTAAIDHVATQVADVVEIDFKSASVGVAFTPLWSSRPITAEDVAAIELLIRNAYKTSILPTNSTLPAGVGGVWFKTMTGARPAIAMLLDMGSGPGNPASAQNAFLGATDDFAIGVGADFVRRTLEPIRSQILATPVASVTLPVDTWFYTFHIQYSISLNTARIDLEAGKIVLVLTGHAHTATSWMPDFDFTVRQAFTLQPDGATATLVLGELSLDTSSWVVNLFRGAAASAMSSARDQALASSGVYATVRRALDAYPTLGALLDSLLAPPDQKVVPLGHRASLAYTSADITPDGITLHGSIGVAAWPAPSVEFEQIAATPNVHDVNAIPTGPDYTALKTWIPGGAIQRYEWSTFGQTQAAYVDENRFVLLHAGPEVNGAMARVNPLRGYAPLCLTVRGTRLSASGPVVPEAVSGSVCAFSTFPIVGGTLAARANGGLPQVALTHPGPMGMEIVGHTKPQASDGKTPAPNLVVYFAADAGSAQLDRIVRALQTLDRGDAATAVLAIVPPASAADTALVPGVVYSSDDRTAWERLFDTTVHGDSETLIVTPDGRVAWRQSGAIDESTLAAALKKSLVRTGDVDVRVRAAQARLGHVPPNFVFDLLAGRQLTLRKLAGRPVRLVFWRSTSQPSIEAVRDQTKLADALVVLAVNDGESADLARRVAAEQKLQATIVVDPAREIARAYGVSVWPTTIDVDGLGVVNSIRYGRDQLEQRAADGDAHVVNTASGRGHR